MYQFNNNNLVTSYIKEMLHSFNLPSCEVWSEGKQCYKDEFYIYKNNVMKALRTGKDLDVNNKLDFFYESTNYVWGMKMPNLTTNLRLDSLTYDSYTHNYLGRYLSFYRDYKGIDLMSLYNCFSNEAVSNIEILDNTDSVILSSGETYTIYSISAKLHKNYTIFIDCPTQIEIVAGYYDKNQLIDLNKSYGINFPYTLTQVIKSNTQFNDPFIYDNLSKVDEWDGLDDTQKALLYKLRKNLKMFIKVPKENKSSIVVLEGDHLNSLNHYLSGAGQKFHKTISALPYNEDGKPIPWYNQNQNQVRNYESRLELTNINSNVNHPFSMRLVEYLFGNVIKPDDEIDNNISRLQMNLVKRPIKEIALNKIEMDGVWTNSLRNVSYALASSKGLVDTKFDILGYVDKDIEHIINLEDGE